MVMEVAAARGGGDISQPFSFTAAESWFKPYFISVLAGLINAPCVFGSNSVIDQMMLCHNQS